ncbi:MAG TPA: ATP-binding protein [Actinomycetota bacterium]
MSDESATKRYDRFMSNTKAARPLLPRHASSEVKRALHDTRVVLINGARQVGKSTLAAEVLRGQRGARQLTLDDQPVLEAARADPVSFVRHEGTLLIDEVQRVPELFLAIKAAVDRDVRPGQFLLTGSAQVLSLPRLSDSLAGRMEIVELWPLSQGELRRRRERFVDELLAGGSMLHVQGSLEKHDYLELAVAGGFPEAARRAPDRRARWFESYVRTLVQRDIKELADIERLGEVPRILRLLAARTAGVLNLDALARDCRMAPSTLRRYLSLLETAFIFTAVPAWSNNKTTRLVRSPKIFLSDSGLAAHLLGATATSLARPTGSAGQVLETFITMELRRQVGWSKERASLYHMRTKEHLEVDVVIEAADGRVSGVEVKAAATVGSADFAGLRYLANKTNEAFACGVVLYTGVEPLTFGSNLFAIPMSSVWES